MEVVRRTYFKHDLGLAPCHCSQVLVRPVGQAVYVVQKLFVSERDWLEVVLRGEGLANQSLSFQPQVGSKIEDKISNRPKLNPLKPTKEIRLASASLYASKRNLIGVMILQGLTNERFRGRTLLYPSLPSTRRCPGKGWWTLTLPVGDDLACNHSESASTPNLSRLAASFPHSVRERHSSNLGRIDKQLL